MQLPSLDSSSGSNRRTTFSSEDIRGIGAWTSAGQRFGGTFRDVSPSISLHELTSADLVDERSFDEGTIDRGSESAQVLKDVKTLFR